MTSISIPAGHVFVPGRSGETAHALLIAADEAGVTRKGIKAVSDGYIITEEVAQAYEGARGDGAPSDTPDETPSGTPDETWKVAQIEEWAGNQDPPIDLSAAKNKAEKLAIINTPAEKE